MTVGNAGFSSTTEVMVGAYVCQVATLDVPVERRRALAHRPFTKGAAAKPASFVKQVVGASMSDKQSRRRRVRQRNYARSSVFLFPQVRQYRRSAWADLRCAVVCSVSPCWAWPRCSRRPAATTARRTARPTRPCPRGRQRWPAAVAVALLDADAGSASDESELLADVLDGQPAVVNLFASWCAPCIEEMPDFEAVYQDVGDEVGFIGVAIDDTDVRALEIVDSTDRKSTRLN